MISIGILAWNEERSIATTLQGIFDQSLLKTKSTGNRKIEIIIVANGCTDQTAQIAQTALDQDTSGSEEISGQVVELTESGKINAWNAFSHPDTEIFILVDADIKFLHENTLQNMTDLLLNKPEIAVATDHPVKHIELQENYSLRDRISLAVSRMTKAAPGQLTGQLYAARACALRQAVLPKGLIVEDGFLKQFLCTTAFTQPLNNDLIQCAPNAAHVFEAYLSIGDILPNQRRQAVGHTLNRLLQNSLLQKTKSGQSAEDFLKEQHQSNPQWFIREIEEYITYGGWWVVFPGALTFRWKRFMRMPGIKKIPYFPVVCVAWCIDIISSIWANQTLKSGAFMNVWKDTNTDSLS